MEKELPRVVKLAISDLRVGRWTFNYIVHVIKHSDSVKTVLAGVVEHGGALLEGETSGSSGCARF